ncbi:MAG: hypothetical protein KGO02_07500 [Alphaproteobacteria bacterium]|nr:hypothetical protein [Alphaproteobacteria bacterium]
MSTHAPARRHTSARTSVRLQWLAVLAPALIIIALALPELSDGLGRVSAEPASEYIKSNVELTSLDYAEAQKALLSTPPADASAHLLAVEAGMLRGERTTVLLPQAKAALALDPGDARGWIVYARLNEPRHLTTAARAVSFSFHLAPREFFLIVPRLYAAAPIWQRLTPSDQALLFAEVRAAGGDTKLHPALIAAMREPGGRAMVTAAYYGRPHALRALNRALTAEILGLSG